MTSARPVRAFGDTAFVVDTSDVEEAHRLAAAIDQNAPPGIEDVIVGFRSVTVTADPATSDIDELGAMLTSVEPIAAATSSARSIDIPVALDGPDLDEVARLANVTPAQVARLLIGADLRVAFVGFAPGFAYLVGLPAELASVPRRPSPRPMVPGGSVALAGGFAGVYPQASPGGWHVVGRSGMRLFDPEVPPYSVLRPGDRVRLRLADVPDPSHEARSTGQRGLLRSDAARTVLVEDPGLLSFVQDRGRVGVAGFGVPRAGAADPYGLRLANRLVGNDEKAAAIEATGRGPSLRFSAPAHVAVVGTADVSIDGRAVPSGSVVPIGAGQTMTTGVESRGLRSYITVSGGIDIPPVLGSRSSDVLCRLGSGALVPGDIVGLGPPGRPRGRVRHRSASVVPAVLRVISGPDPFPAATVDGLISTTWEVDPSSNRIGVRLTTDAPLNVGGESISSRGMVTGAIQVPPDGRPIVLLCDHATVGGYPVIGTVVSADLGVLGQLRPGDAVLFEPVDRAEAVRARAEREQALGDAVLGWYPVRSD